MRGGFPMINSERRRLMRLAPYILDFLEAVQVMDLQAIRFRALELHDRITKSRVPPTRTQQSPGTAVAERTTDAYSFQMYGIKSWRACCRMLANRGYSDREIEAIMRSKWPQFAAEAARYPHRRPMALDLSRWMNERRPRIGPAEVVELVRTTFKDTNGDQEDDNGDS